MNSDQILMTREGYDKIVKEHEYLVSVRRGEVAERIKEAISYGDISENAEYDSAKNEQAELEDRILKLENMLRKGKIISEDELTGDHVNLGLHVLLKDRQTKDQFEYIIVGATEADPFAGKISNESPVGKALLGKMAGEVVDIQTEMGTLSLEVLKIRKA
ncbi:MAG TPA: transcription elongation factor GreA [Clostridiales bacterium]|jgi:transcription elongation factor GreA|nr:transcription elongation factor GreA [Clostridiales bacterium]